MLSSSELERISSALSGQKEALTLTLHGESEPSSFQEMLAELATTVQGAASDGVTVKQGTGAGLPGLPALSLSSGAQGGVHYLAVPEDRETGPFVEAVLALGEGGQGGAAGEQGDAAGGQGGAAGWVKSLSTLEKPAELMVFIATACPHCPQAVRAANRLAAANALVTTYVVDAQRLPDLAKRFNVQSVPLTIIDSELAVVGVVSPDSLVERLMSREDGEYQVQVFHSLVETGRLTEAVDRVCGGGGLAGFLESWRQSSTSSRMGLMLVADDVLERERSAMDTIVCDLLPLLEAEDGALRGDTADLLGRIGHPSAADPLRALLEDANPDVAEIAEDALGEIQERSDGAD
ncbi:thioredoxin family protein [Planctomycetota bacterium]